jgi:hypothetical protein
MRNYTDSGASLADRIDSQRSCNQARKTALTWMKLFAFVGVAAFLSGLWIIGLVLLAVSVGIGIKNL